WLALAEAGGDKLGGEGRFPRTRRAGNEQTIALENASAEHLIQLGNADGNPAPAQGFRFSAGQAERAREGLDAVIGNADGMEPRDGSLTTKLGDLQLSHDGIALRHLGEPEESIGHGEHGITADLFLFILANEK